MDCWNLALGDGREGCLEDLAVIMLLMLMMWILSRVFFIGDKCSFGMKV